LDLINAESQEPDAPGAFQPVNSKRALFMDHPRFPQIAPVHPIVTALPEIIPRRILENEVVVAEDLQDASHFTRRIEAHLPPTVGHPGGRLPRRAFPCLKAGSIHGTRGRISGEFA
jgi:hypothetical protein